MNFAFPLPAHKLIQDVYCFLLHHSKYFQTYKCIIIVQIKLWDILAENIFINKVIGLSIQNIYN